MVFLYNINLFRMEFLEGNPLSGKNCVNDFLCCSSCATICHIPLLDGKNYMRIQYSTSIGRILFQIVSSEAGRAEHFSRSEFRPVQSCHLQPSVPLPAGLLGQVLLPFSPLANMITMFSYLEIGFCQFGPFY
jgi:hypothetical protein